MTENRRPRSATSRLALYLLGFSLPGCAIVALNAPVGGPAFTYRSANQLFLSSYVFILIPLIAAWGVAAIRHRLSPRDAFSNAAVHPLFPVIRGLGAGIVTMALVGAIVVLSSTNLRLDAIVVATNIPAVWFSLLERRPTYAGFLCRACRYDLRGSLAAGRCPECGLEFDAPAPPGMPMATPVGEAA